MFGTGGDFVESGSAPEESSLVAQGGSPENSATDKTNRPGGGRRKTWR